MLFITETFLRAHNNVRWPNYVFYREDRPGCHAGGGTAIAVKNCLGHYRVVLPPCQNIEVTAVEFPGVLGCVLLVSPYKQPIAPILDAELDTLFGAHGKVMLAFSLNCKHPDWVCRLTTPYGRALYRYLLEHNLRAYGPGQPTHYPPLRGA